MKIAIIPHIDADGLASAALMFRILKKIYDAEIKFYFPLDTYIPKNLIKEKYDLIVGLDIHPKEFKKIEGKKLVIDHHKPFLNLDYAIQKDYGSTTYLIYNLYKEYIDEKYYWLVALGCLGDKDEECLKKFNFNLKDLPQKLNYLRASRGKLGIYGVNLLLSLEEKYYLYKSNPNYKIIEEFYKKIYNEINRALFTSIQIVDKNYTIIEICSKYNIQNIIASYLINSNPLIFVVNKCLNPLPIEVRSLKINTIQLVENLCKFLNCLSYGGHERASGMLINKKKYEEFKKTSRLLLPL